MKNKKKLCGFSYTQNIANFEAFRQKILLSANLLFLKSDSVIVLLELFWILVHCELPHYWARKKCNNHVFQPLSTCFICRLLLNAIVGLEKKRSYINRFTRLHALSYEIKKYLVIEQYLIIKFFSNQNQVYLYICTYYPVFLKIENAEQLSIALNSAQQQCSFFGNFFL